ncbi:MAG: hypothetical protein GC161_15580 [Planctomycetaceae bacterium]|nr:hypothetical protein [Planctomycetaceae bacterium]
MGAWALIWLAAAALCAPAQGPASIGTPAAATASAAEVLLTLEEALELAFPDCDIEKRTVYLDDAQRREVERRLGATLPSAVARPYVARAKGKDGEAGAIVGVAWVDTHRVRTLRQTLLFAVTPEGRVRRLEVLAFLEPKEYLPKVRWFEQLLGRPLDPEFELGRAIRPISGATLSARATVDAARRSLALHGVLFPPPPPKPIPEPTPEPIPRSAGDNR